jgi:hypothetical protein
LLTPATSGKLPASHDLAQWILALRGLPAGAAARAIAALAAIPPYAAVAVVVTLLLAALQALAGAWLARALVPRRSAAAGDREREPGEVGGVVPGPAVDR